MLRQQLEESEARLLQRAPDEAQRQWLAERLELERRLEEAQRSLELVTQKALREKAQLLDTERMLKEQMKSMQAVPERPLTTAVAPTSDLQALKAGGAKRGHLVVEDSVTQMVAELRSKELQRNQMQQQVEHDKQLKLGEHVRWRVASRMALERKFQKQLQEARSRTGASLAAPKIVSGSTLGPLG